MFGFDDGSGFYLSHAKRATSRAERVMEIR